MGQPTTAARSGSIDRKLQTRKRKKRENTEEQSREKPLMGC